MISRNITVNGRRTSVRLEPEVWKAFEDVARIERTTVNALASKIDLVRGDESLTAAIRAYLFSRLHDAFRALQALSGAFRAVDEAFQLTPAQVPAPPTVADESEMPYASPAVRRQMTRASDKKETSAAIIHALNAPMTLLNLYGALPDIPRSRVRGVLTQMVRAGTVIEIRNGRKRYRYVRSEVALAGNDECLLEPVMVG
ncbi:ribbon-helix-helix domain-containing protein [Azospirillum rugosum]|uniref:DNA-binding ribbon-helix-helix protein n=1 Tax=Azospirillum rugosum TaxID=416170 RepID=A0ABS4SER4_9PROT|nr:ribbon-helix-helix domain-containing protein [Azospirillum rugosum]MBP2291059.1 putative DNA-binding ribbon-helix-helix protein [Azospirillum rugosum]MDQ0524877.1 putative DNA-binding ribbon-helix-helix protein [Azospirillum rugosum]